MAVDDLFTVQTLVQRLGARLLCGDPAAAARIERIYAGDTISNLLEHSSPSTLLITNLVTRQLIRVAELMDVPAICLLNGAEPDPELLEAARRRGTTLLVSPFDMFETCGRLYPVLGKPR